MTTVSAIAGARRSGASGPAPACWPTSPVRRAPRACSQSRRGRSQPRERDIARQRFRGPRRVLQRPLLPRQLPEPADVLVTETLWNFGAGEGMAGLLADARGRFLKPGARIIPAAVDLHVAAVQTDSGLRDAARRPADRHGIDLSPLRHYQVNNVHMPHLAADDFLAETARLLSTELDESAAADFDAERHGRRSRRPASCTAPAAGLPRSCRPASRSTTSRRRRRRAGRMRSSPCRTRSPCCPTTRSRSASRRAPTERSGAGAPTCDARARSLAAYDQSSSLGFPRAAVRGGGRRQRGRPEDDPRRRGRRLGPAGDGRHAQPRGAREATRSSASAAASRSPRTRCTLSATPPRRSAASSARQLIRAARRASGR